MAYMRLGDLLIAAGAITPVSYTHLDVYKRQHEKLRTETVAVQGEEIYTFGANETFLYLLCHSLQHFLHGGCGIRAVCDLSLIHISMMNICLKLQKCMLNQHTAKEA